MKHEKSRFLRHGCVALVATVFAGCAAVPPQSPSPDEHRTDSPPVIGWTPIGPGPVRDLDLPVMGIKIPGYLRALPEPAVAERLDGYHARFLFGQVVVDLFRADAAAPKDAEVTNPDYQETLNREFRRNNRIERSGLSRVGGIDAWVIVGRRTISMGAVQYQREMVVIVDGHLLRVSISGLGFPHRPAGFDRAATMLDQMRFEPIVLPSTPAPKRGVPAKATMPKFIGSRDIEYPVSALARGHQGTVDLGFSIDANGRVRGIRTLYATHRELVSPVFAFLNSGRFQVPGNWPQSGSENSRFAMEFQFAIVGAIASCPPGTPARIPDAEVFRICRAFRRSPW